MDNLRKIQAYDSVKSYIEKQINCLENSIKDVYNCKLSTDMEKMINKKELQAIYNEQVFILDMLNDVLQ